MTTATFPGLAPSATGSWAARVLVATVVAAHVLVVGGISLWAVTALSGGDRPTVAAWCLATFAIAATLPPSYRWIHEGVDDLLSSPSSWDASPFAALPDELDGPTEVLRALAATMREALDAAMVTIEVWPAASRTPMPTSDASPPDGPWAAGATATAGPSARPSIELPLQHGGGDLGVVRVALPGRAGRGAAALHLVVDLTRQAALVVSSEVLREQVAASRERMVLAREEERRRLRRDLHDGLGPSLAAIRLQVGALRRQLEPLGHEVGQVDEIRRSVAEATDEVRRVVEDLRPPMLDDCGLVEAVRNLRILPAGLQLHIDSPEPMPPLPAAVEVALYRIVVEALHNVVRHAGAEVCTVELHVGTSQVELVVTDDGVGPPQPPRAGVGTASMGERAAELGGALRVEAAAPMGTRVVAVLPVRDGARS